MAFLRASLVVLFSVLGISRCAFVDSLNKCALADKSCHKALVQKVIKDIAVQGIPELDIPSIDPVHVKNLNISILNIVNLILLEGTVKGIKDCIIENTDVDVEHLRASIKLTCDVIIKGKYDLKSSSDFIKSLLGGEASGKGNAAVKIEKITINIDFPFEVIKRGKDTFFTSDLKKYKYTFNIHKKVTFSADNIYLGDKESSKEVVQLMNENWKTIIDTFGNHFLDIAMKQVYAFLYKFFSNVPTKYYIKDDLSHLVQ